MLLGGLKIFGHWLPSGLSSRPESGSLIEVLLVLLNKQRFFLDDFETRSALSRARLIIFFVPIGTSKYSCAVSGGWELSSGKNLIF